MELSIHTDVAGIQVSGCLLSFGIEKSKPSLGVNLKSSKSDSWLYHPLE